VKLSVSNIAWDPEEEEEILALLSRLEVAGIEIAPTKLWPDWVGATPAAAEEARATISAQGFEVPALQAILFGKPELSVFGTSEVQAELVDHVDHVATLAAALGARVLVFGSPRNRDPGERSPEEAKSLAVDVFTRMGERCAGQGVQLCLEPNPAVYHCRFMTSWRDAWDVVKAVNHAGVCLHLDAACIKLEGDDVIEAVETCAGSIAHFHVTEPDLGDFASPVLNHRAIGEALKRSGYEGWLSIEMRRSENPVRSVEEAVSQVREWYS
jgi:sugar phosphate isomerase/epimerase